MAVTRLRRLTGATAAFAVVFAGAVSAAILPGGPARASSPTLPTTETARSLYMNNWADTTGILQPQDSPYGNDSIGRITVRGSVTASTAPGVVKPEFIAPGSDGALWFTNFAGTIARITEKPAAHISLSASSGPPASEVTVSGTSFGAFEHVKILFADSTHGTTTLATVLTDAAGRFSAVVTIPAGASSGSQHIKAKGLASALHASRAFTVT